MTDEAPKKRQISEISHLFLSTVRDLHGHGMPAPRRVPPGGRLPESEAPSDDARGVDDADLLLPPEAVDDFASNAVAGSETLCTPTAYVPPVTALIAAHFGDARRARVDQLARYMAGQVGRVGVIELGAAGFRLSCFERGDDLAGEAGSMAPYCTDGRQFAEAVEEMSCDVRHWLIEASDLSEPDRNALLGDANWLLLSTCDHDGVVSSYRALKGLSTGRQPPRVTLALLDARDAAETDRVHRKLSGVCEQFLGWPLGLEVSCAEAADVSGCVVMTSAPGAAGADCAASYRETIARLIERSKAAKVEAGLEFVEEEQQAAVAPIDEPMPRQCAEEITGCFPRAESPAPVVRLVADVVVPTDPTPAPAPAPAPTPVAPMMHLTPEAAPDVTEVIDLPGADASADAILSAVLQGRDAGLVECPVRPPACPSARLALSRDRTLTLVAVSRQGLSDLRAIGQAWRWLNENRALIGMAVPQFAIDPARAPRLRMLVDQSDIAADVLQPMLQSDHVAVQAYRRLKWGGRMGLLLDAA